jgi:hypothetical protein
MNADKKQNIDDESSAPEITAVSILQVGNHDIQFSKGNFEPECTMPYE